MYYVMTQDYNEVECVGEYDSWADAVKRSEMFEDAWICTDKEV